MGSLFQLLDINEDSMAKKVVRSTRQVGGLEAPRNSLKLPVETSYGSYAGRDRIPYSGYLTNETSEKGCYSSEAPIKKLISEEISKRPNTRQNAPSIVARLMGVDMLPFDSGQAPQMVGKKNETPASRLMDKQQLKKGSIGRDTSTSNSSLQLDLGSFGQNFNGYSDHFSSRMNLKKLKSREHPQEEELQNFKKEFEAWQAARFKECSKVVNFGSTPSQLIAQDELNRGKKFLCANSDRMKTSETLMGPKGLSVTAGPHKMLTSHNCEKDYLLAGMKESICSNRRSRTDFGSSKLTSLDQKLDVVSAPTKIVVLRPGPDRMGISEDSWNSTPSTLEERGSIEDFLEEVKEKLKSELQGKSSKRITTIRGGGIETPYREKPSEPRQIAQRIAQQVRDSVTRDLGMNLLRSESTRSYRSDIQLNGTSSPEFINRDTRKLLTERLKNALKGETHREVPMPSHKSSISSSALDYEKCRTGQSSDIWSENKMSCSESFDNDVEKQFRSFRQEASDGGMYHKELSRGNLIRSLSAPVAGTSFGKLLLEDRNILTGAQIRRKHEAVENVSMNVKKQKDKFNIREKVSSLRYSLTLRGRLFRRRVQSVEELHYDKDDLFKDITSGPTVMMSFYETHENFTEVPPSPASVCSSVCDEFWRSADYSSPTPSGVHQLEDSETPHVFSQINSNLNELRRKLNQLECSGLEEATIEEQQPHEVETDIKDPAEAYIRDLLVASGWYDGSCSKWDPLGKPISNQVFEEAENFYKQCTKVDENCAKDEGAKLNHKMILELVNEALPVILGHQPVNMSRYMEKGLGHPVHMPPCGRKLLSHVWKIIGIYLHPPVDKSYYALDNMLAQDLRPDPWPRLMDDEINGMGKDLECHIIGDLIEEMVYDM